MKKVFIQDIAKDMNLSRNTVSKALSNSESVTYETRQRIIKRAIEMGYKKLEPELIAEMQDTTVSQTGNVAVLAHREIADFWNRIVMGISKELNKNNLNLIFNFIDREEEENLQLPASVSDKNVDGIILLSVFKIEYIHKLLEVGIPVVFLDGPINGAGNELNGDMLIVEGEKSTHALTKQLISEGRKKLGFIGDISYCKTIFDRWNGFARALSEENLAINKDMCFISHAPERYFRSKELIPCLESLKEIPEAFVCSSDHIAIKVIKFFKEKGYRIPEDIAVTGFDDERDAVVIEPSLTTVHVYNEAIGKRLVQELIWRLDNPDMPYEKIVIDSKVVYRKSFPEK